MILYIYIDPRQGQITSDDKVLSIYRAFVTSIIFVKFHHDTPNSEGTSGQKTFLYTGARANNSYGVKFEHHRKLLSL